MEGLKDSLTLSTNQLTPSRKLLSFQDKTLTEETSAWMLRELKEETAAMAASVEDAVASEEDVAVSVVVTMVASVETDVVDEAEEVDSEEAAEASEAEGPNSIKLRLIHPRCQC